MRTGWEPEATTEHHNCDLSNFGLEDRPVTFVPVFSGDAFREAVQYPIIVEMWDKVVGRNTGGRMRRAWLATFNEVERKVISRYHTMFHRWYLVTGTPRHIAMRLATFTLLQRAVDFFANVESTPRQHWAEG